MEWEYILISQMPCYKDQILKIGGGISIVLPTPVPDVLQTNTCVQVHATLLRSQHHVVCRVGLEVKKEEADNSSTKTTEDTFSSRYFASKLTALSTRVSVRPFGKGNGLIAVKNYQCSTLKYMDYRGNYPVLLSERDIQHISAEETETVPNPAGNERVSPREGARRWRRFPPLEELPPPLLSASSKWQRQRRQLLLRRSCARKCPGRSSTKIFLSSATIKAAN
ncbi:hypothetical protein EK904_010174 [Melospiza melodia maxima]|nr:hypothetical protein EK904_010174 [Melospiza melodia maxima]